MKRPCSNCGTFAVLEPWSKLCIGCLANGILRIEDVKCKATRTPLYRLKKKIVEANYGIEITEV